MGNNSSKTTLTTPVNIDGPKIAANCTSPEADGSMRNRMLLDPRSPDVNRTPLPENLVNRFISRIQNEDAIDETIKTDEIIKTPVNAFRKRLLSISTSETKFIDPRSPSQFIPRTPISMSLDDTKMASTTHFSLEYTGMIEEASCRNFNERLANLTLDDSDTDVDSKPKIKLQKIREEDSVEVPADILAAANTHNVSAEISMTDDGNRSDPRSPSGCIPRTPLLLSTVTPSILITRIQEADGAAEKNISPIVCETITEPSSVQQTFSSTPIVPMIGVRKTTITKRNALLRAEIFEDEEEIIEEAKEQLAIDGATTHNKSLEVLVTPAKRAMKNHGNEKPRTPLGVLNRRSRSFENLSKKPSITNAANIFKAKANNENIFATPKAKNKITLDTVNGVAFKPHKIQVYND